MPQAAPDFNDPRCLLLGYEADGDLYRFAWMDLGEVGAAPFLDRRMADVWKRSFVVAGPDVPQLGMPHGAWLFHTAFCGSTLLARALHAPPRNVSLKEPSVLYDLAYASATGASGASLSSGAQLHRSVALLMRPWTQDGTVVVKPTNAVSRLMSGLLAATPESRAILLHGSLEDFLLSCLKKLPAAETPMRWMMQHVLPGTQLERRLGIPDDHPFNFVECCVLTWYAQIERYALALRADGDDRLRTLDMAALFSDPQAVVAACTGWLQLRDEPDRHERTARVDAVFSRNAKQADKAYGPGLRASERSDLRQRYDRILTPALDWAGQQVAPHAQLPTDWKALLS